MIATFFTDAEGIEHVRVADRELPSRQRGVPEGRAAGKYREQAIFRTGRSKVRKAEFGLRQIAVASLGARRFRTVERVRQAERGAQAA